MVMGPLYPSSSEMRCYFCHEVTEDNWALVTDERFLEVILQDEGPYFMNPEDVARIPESKHITLEEIRDGRFDAMVIACEFCTDAAVNALGPEDRIDYQFTGHEGWLKEWDH